jgi:hypothetical protein
MSLWKRTSKRVGIAAAGIVLAALVLPSSAAAAGLSLDQIQTIDQARSYFSLNSDPSSNRVDAVFYTNESAKGKFSGNPFIKYDNITFPLTAAFSQISGPVNSSYKAWVFQSAQPASGQLGFVIERQVGKPNLVRLFFAPSDPVQSLSVAQDTISSDSPSWIANVDSGVFNRMDAFGQGFSDILPNDSDSRSMQQTLSDFQTAGWTPITLIGTTEPGVTGDGGISLPNPISTAFNAVGKAINGLLGSIISNYVQVLHSLLTTNYLDFYSGSQTCSMNANAPPVQQQGVPGQTAPPASPQISCAVQSVWSHIRDIVDILFILVLIVIAFMNVIHVEIEYYAIRVLLPRFVIAAILVNFSLVIVQVILDATAVLTNSLFTVDSLNNLLSWLNGTTTGALALGAGFFDTFVLMTVVLGILTVVAVLFARIVFIWLLAVTSPIAYLLMVLPATRGLYRWWWKSFIGAVLIAPIMGVALLIAGEVSSMNFGGDTNAHLIQAGLVVALLFVAGILPAVIGGRVFSFVHGSLSKGHKGLRGTALSNSRGMQALSQYNKRVREPRAIQRGAATLDAIGTLTGGHMGTTDQARIMAADDRKKRGDMFEAKTTGSLLYGATHDRQESDRAANLINLVQRGVLGNIEGADGDIGRALQIVERQNSVATTEAVISEVAKRNPGAFDPNGTATQRAARGVSLRVVEAGGLIPPIWGPGKDPTVELAMRMDTKKWSDVERGFIARSSAEWRGNVIASEQALSDMNLQKIDAMVNQQARQSLSDSMRDFGNKLRSERGNVDSFDIRKRFEDAIIQAVKEKKYDQLPQGISRDDMQRYADQFNRADDRAHEWRDQILRNIIRTRLP